SLDGIDAVLARITKHRFQLLHRHSHPLPEALCRDLQALCRPGDNEIERAGPLHRALGRCYADAVASLLDDAGETHRTVTAIGCHGQTIRHCPGPDGFSLQLGCADTLACTSGLPVVHDFRNK
ncbi:anhydro-N-acetylmuramic acid kinase, partial [Vibrio agarivorans]